MSTNTVAGVIEAIAYLDGTWCTFEIPELSTESPRGAGHRIVAMGQARKLKDVATAARDVAALWLDLDDFKGDITVTVRDAALSLWGESNSLDEQAREKVKEAADKRREAVQTLIANGASQSDAALAFGVSVQRVSQLAH